MALGNVLYITKLKCKKYSKSEQRCTARIAGVPLELSMTGTPVCMLGTKIERRRTRFDASQDRFMQYHARF